MEREEQRNSSDVSYILHSDIFNIGRVPKTIEFVNRQDLSKSLSGTASLMAMIVLILHVC